MVFSLRGNPVFHSNSSQSAQQDVVVSACSSLLIGLPRRRLPVEIFEQRPLGWPFLFMTLTSAAEQDTIHALSSFFRRSKSLSDFCGLVFTASGTARAPKKQSCPSEQGREVAAAPIE